MSDKPSVVLVHGGFVDGSGWLGAMAVQLVHAHLSRTPAAERAT